MIQELIHTSAPEGLQRGSRGFCTVLCTKGMPRNLIEFLESHSGYRHCSQPPHPENFSHVSVRLGGHRYHVLSRIANCAADYTGRTNKLAHHLALTPDELAPGGPAHILQAKYLWKTAWNETPQWVENTPNLPTDRPAAGKCPHWSQLTNDAGWAGVLADSALNGGRPMSVIFKAGTADTLALVDEAIRLMPPDRYWDVTFSTYFTGLGAGVECQWRFLLDGTREADIARRNTHAPLIDLVDLARTHKRAPDSAAAQAARDGVELQKQRLAPPPPPPARTGTPTRVAARWKDEEDEDPVFAAAFAEAAEAEAKSARAGVPPPPPPPPPSLPTASPFEKRSAVPKKWNWAVAVPVTIAAIMFLLLLVVVGQFKKRVSHPRRAASVAQADHPNANRQGKGNARPKQGKGKASVQDKTNQSSKPNVFEKAAHAVGNAVGIGTNSKSSSPAQATARNNPVAPTSNPGTNPAAGGNSGTHRVASSQPSPPPPSKPTYQPLPEFKRNEPFQQIANLNKADPSKVQLTLFPAAVNPSNVRRTEPYELKKSDGKWLVTVKKKAASIETDMPVAAFKLDGNFLQFKWDGNAPSNPDPNGLRYSLLEVKTGFATKKFFLCPPPQTTAAGHFDFTKRLPIEIPFACPAFVNSNNLKLDLKLNPVPRGWKIRPTSFSGMELAQSPEIIRIDPNIQMPGPGAKVCRMDFEVELTFTYDTKRNKPLLNYTAYCFPGKLINTGTWYFEQKRTPWIIGAVGHPTKNDSFEKYRNDFALMYAAIQARMKTKQQIDNRIKQIDNELNRKPPPKPNRETELRKQRKASTAERSKIESELQDVKAVPQTAALDWKNRLYPAMKNDSMKQVCLLSSIYIELQGEKLVLVTGTLISTNRH